MLTNLKNNIFGGTWTSYIVFALRILVGVVFIFSGFVKAIDPWGSIYKFYDYFVALGLTSLEPFLLFCAVAVAVVEFVCGVCVLVGAYRSGVTIVIAMMMLVMTPLTFWLALTDKVPDCGCFGDALVISNWATFWKNVVITLAVVYLILFNKKAKNIYGVSVQWMVALLAFAFVGTVAMVGYFYQPLLDFRPYKIGTTVVAAESSVNDDDFVFIYQKAGHQKEFTINNLPDESWTFIDRKQKSKPASSRGIVVRDGDIEVTDSVIRKEGDQILLIFNDMNDIDVSYTYLINQIYDEAQSSGVDVVGLTPASAGEIARWNDLSMASYRIFQADASDLKMIARGNPAVIYMRDGKILWKRTLQSISSERVVASPDDLASIADDFIPSRWLSSLSVSFMVAMFLLLLINRTHKVVKFSCHKIKKNQNKAVPLHSEKEN